VRSGEDLSEVARFTALVKRAFCFAMMKLEAFKVSKV